MAVALLYPRLAMKPTWSWRQTSAMMLLRASFSHHTSTTCDAPPIGLHGTSEPLSP